MNRKLTIEGVDLVLPQIVRQVDDEEWGEFRQWAMWRALGYHTSITQQSHDQEHCQYETVVEMQHRIHQIFGE